MREETKKIQSSYLKLIFEEESLKKEAITMEEHIHEVNVEILRLKTERIENLRHLKL